MSDSPNVSVVRRLYEARGNPDIIRQVLASNIRWDVTEGFPHSGVYVGVDNLLQDFFGPLFQDFETFQADGSEFFESGDHVIALGHYSARTKGGRQVTPFRTRLDTEGRADRCVAADGRYGSVCASAGQLEQTYPMRKPYTRFGGESIPRIGDSCRAGCAPSVGVSRTWLKDRCFRNPLLVTCPYVYLTKALVPDLEPTRMGYSKIRR